MSACVSTPTATWFCTAGAASDHGAISSWKGFLGPKTWQAFQRRQQIPSPYIGLACTYGQLSSAPARVLPNLLGRLLAATVMAVDERAGATSQLSLALLPEATTTGMPTTSVMCCTASSRGFDQAPAGTPRESDTTAGLTAFAATQSRAAPRHREDYTVSFSRRVE